MYPVQIGINGVTDFFQRTALEHVAFFDCEGIFFRTSHNVKDVSGWEWWREWAGSRECGYFYFVASELLQENTEILHRCLSLLQAERKNWEVRPSFPANIELLFLRERKEEIFKSFRVFTPSWYLACLCIMLHWKSNF